MARNTSLRALLNPNVENTLMVGAAGTVMAGAMAGAILGPLGFLVLALTPIDVAAAVMMRRRRERLRAEVVAKASGPGRGVAIVEESSEAGGVRGGQRSRDVRARVTPVTGAPFIAEAEVFWTDAQPGAKGVAAWTDQRDVLLYFAEGPETPAETERALNVETGQYRREAVLPGD